MDRLHDIPFLAGTLLLAFGILLPGVSADESVGDVVINEVMWMGSTLSSADQWIELHNLTDSSVDIGGWHIDNALSAHNTLIIEEGSVIPAGGYFLIARYPSSGNSSDLNVVPDMYPVSNLSLSNSNNGNLVLRDNKGNIVDVAKGDSWPAGENVTGDDPVKRSMQRRQPFGDGMLADSWETCVNDACTDEVFWKTTGGNNYGTPGDENILLELDDGDEEEDVLPEEDDASFEEEEEESVEHVSIGEVRQRMGRIVSFDGVVITPPGVVGQRVLYAMEERGGGVPAGVQVYVFDADSVSVQLGDRVRVTGEVTSVQGETRVRMASSSDIVVLSSGDDVSPLAVLASDIGIHLEGVLVELSGAVSSPQGSTFYLDDDTGEVRVVIQSHTNIVKPRTPQGTPARIVGIVSQTSSGFRILPRYQEDVEFGEDSEQEDVRDDNDVEEERDDALQILLRDARNYFGRQVSFEATVSSPFGVVGQRVMYVTDGEDIPRGIQVYAWDGASVTARLGDTVRVTGTVSRSQAETRIAVADPQDISVLFSGDAPHPFSVSAGEIDEHLEGVLVELSGVVSSPQGSTFYLDDDTGEVRVVIQSHTNIVKPRTPQGTPARIVGIVSQTSSGFRILPRYQEDVEFGEEVQAARSSRVSGSVVRANSLPPRSVQAPLNYDHISFPSRMSDVDITTSVAGAVEETDFRQRLFLVFGGVAACVQLLGGIAHEEAVFRKKRDIRNYGEKRI